MELIICPHCGTGNQIARHSYDFSLNNRRWGGSGQPCEKCGQNLRMGKKSHYFYYYIAKGNQLAIDRYSPLEGSKRHGMRGKKGLRKMRRWRHENR